MSTDSNLNADESPRPAALDEQPAPPRTVAPDDESHALKFEPSPDDADESDAAFDLGDLEKTHSPLAASVLTSNLGQSRPAANSDSTAPHPWLRPLARLAGHLVFALLGLVIGYIVLCLINPRGNFLQLPLPGLR
ncbi:MAG: hypothetical protein K1X71_08990 [Pirellulales bacterium]|nr:hypothetical protein [Pirellulales bacterium]